MLFKEASLLISTTTTKFLHLGTKLENIYTFLIPICQPIKSIPAIWRFETEQENKQAYPFLSTLEKRRFMLLMFITYMMVMNKVTSQQKNQGFLNVIKMEKVTRKRVQVPLKIVRTNRSQIHKFQISTVETKIQKSLDFRRSSLSFKRTAHFPPQLISY